MWRDKKKIKNNNFVASDLHLSLLFLFFAIFPFFCLYTAKHFRVSTKCLLESTCACNFYVNEYFLYEINFFPSNVSGVTVLAKKKKASPNWRNLCYIQIKMNEWTKIMWPQKQQHRKIIKNTTQFIHEIRDDFAVVIVCI